MAWFSEDGTTKYTQGPDCDTGPDCCCGKCTFVTLATNCDNNVCCKCVPRYICAVFTPDTITDLCPIVSAEINWNGGNWTGGLRRLDPLDVDNSIEINLQQIGQYSQCYYQVRMPSRDIDDLYLIEGGKRQCSAYPEFRMKCRDPYFVYEDFELDGCTGTLVIQRRDLAKVPFHSEVDTDSTVTSSELSKPLCGTCSEWCTALCMEWTNGGLPQKATFSIKEGGSVVAWEHREADGNIATITTEEIEGQCHLVIDHEGLGGFQKIPIPYQMCNLGMVIEADGTGEWAGKTVSISCNRCSCWDYICERCRCVCKTFCVVSVDGPEQTDITYYELEWDERKLRWGTDTKWVGMRANPDTGLCEFVISGWNDISSDASVIDNSASTITIEECGKDMHYYVTIDNDEAFSTGNFRYEYGVCKSCNPECFKLLCGDCCNDCDTANFPDTLFFDIRGSTIAGEPEDSPLCLDIADIPLVHTQPLFAEKHRWEGHAIVPCLNPLGSPTGPNNTRIDIVITCNGSVFELTVRMRCAGSSSATIHTIYSNDPIWTTSFSCSPLTWIGVLSSDLVPSCCCNGVFQFEFAVSE